MPELYTWPRNEPRCLHYRWVVHTACGEEGCARGRVGGDGHPGSLHGRREPAGGETPAHLHSVWPLDL